MKKYSPKIEAMRSKEEILRQAMSTFQADPNPQIYRAMDEYAKEVAIEFLKWYSLNSLTFIEYLKKDKLTVWANPKSIEEKLEQFEGKTIPELFNQFLQSQSKNKNHAK